MNVLIKIVSALVGSAIVYGGRRVFNWFDFVPRRLESLSIGTYFSSFQATTPGDQYNYVLCLQIANQSGKPLYIVRAIYFLRGSRKMPVYENAWRSSKKPNGYELKFGPQWKSIDILIQPGERADTYLPLAKPVIDSVFPQGKRGTLYMEYISDGKTGIHSAKL